MEKTVKLDGVTKTFSHQRINDKTFEFQIGEESHSVVVHQNREGEMHFTWNNQNYRVYASQKADGKVQITYKTIQWQVEEQSLDHYSADDDDGDEGDARKLISPFPGKVIKIMVKVGDHVKKGETLMVMEAMKLETPMTAIKDVIVEKILVAEGDGIEADALLMSLQEIEENNA